MNLFVRVIIQTLAVLIASYVLTGIEVGSLWTAIVVAILLGVVNIFVKPIFLILTLPLTILTLGLFIFVINALMVLLVSALVPGFYVASFWWALAFSLVVSLVTAFLENLKRN